MKKLVLIFALAAFVFSSQAFAKKKNVDFDAEVQESERDDLQKEKDASKSSAKSKKIYRFGNDYSIQKGLVRMETVRASGAVLFYIVNGKKIYPAVETNEYGQSNYFSIYVDAREYRLNKNERCSYHYDLDEDSLTEIFTVSDIAEVKLVYTISKMEKSDEQENCVLAKCSVKNLTGKKRAFALKSVYNLCLGENRKFHYSTPLNNAVLSEYVVFPSEDESWVISSDSQNAVEFVVYGDGITSPKKVAMANKNVIENSNLSTSFKPGNSFSSLMAYNNSSLALFWDAVELDPEASASYSYKINFSVSDFQNSGKFRPAAKKSAKKSDADDDASKADAAQAPGEDYIDPSKLNEEYVQQLINHINSLEQSDPSLNRLKIQQLQTEVDEVLQVLRSRK